VAAKPALFLKKLASGLEIVTADAPCQSTKGYLILQFENSF